MKSSLDIWNYLQNELEPNAASAFEKELENDPAFKIKVEEAQIAYHPFSPTQDTITNEAILEGLELEIFKDIPIGEITIPLKKTF